MVENGRGLLLLIWLFTDEITYISMLVFVWMDFFFFFPREIVKVSSIFHYSVAQHNFASTSQFSESFLGGVKLMN